MHLALAPLWLTWLNVRRSISLRFFRSRMDNPSDLWANLWTVTEVGIESYFRFDCTTVGQRMRLSIPLSHGVPHQKAICPSLLFDVARERSF